MLNHIGYYFLLLFEKVILLFPKRARVAFFKALATFAYTFATKYRKIVRINLEFTFGKGALSKEEITQITRYSFVNLLLNILHLIEVKNLPKEKLKSYIHLKNESIVHKVKKENKAVIFVTMHYGSWEYAGACVGLYFDTMSVVYKRLKNKIYEEWLLSARAAVGNSSLEKTGVLKKLIKKVKNREDIGILIDTNINKRDGIEVKFFGRDVTHTAIASFLARKYDAVIIPAVATTHDEINYTVTFYDPIETKHTDDVNADITTYTQLQAKWMQEVIKKEPKFWFWLHRRFKSDYKEIYDEV